MNTKQFEFNAVVAHLYAQGAPAKNPKGYCAYRGVSNTSCAVGCRIPDSAYHPEMDMTDKGGTLGNVLKHFPGVLPVEVSTYKTMFRDLQKVHDSFTSCDSDGKFNLDILGSRLAEVANDHDLTFTVPTKGE